jgi:hypothetical protein
VLSQHAVRRSILKIRIRVKIVSSKVRRTNPVTSGVKGRDELSLLNLRRVQVAIDLFLVILLLITSIVAWFGPYNHYYYRYERSNLPGSLIS